ncbi:SOS response-associated peptidase [Streptomyces alkaliphilus]|uniref:Abasic site processing protein n=1 Tax=Streptomyces alkaliphilus TaxID=1472722 RepID=A0A7W3Y499_9ACTN|nr:SOS response-associated peptidase [Streptomyces alkaliphilus]MBB0247152.1 SOS response-associated peptidase [Streptomyces alkaliphilus]
MCGRYAISRRPEELAALFDIRHLAEDVADLGPDWNVAPTKRVPAVLERPLKEADGGSGNGEPVRQLRPLRWGLVPSWAKSPDVGVKMINARAETVHEKPSYRKPFVARRCLLPADGYYEWLTFHEERKEEEKGRRKRPRKQPWYITPADGSVMALAGLYEFWRDSTLPEDHPGAWWATCTVVTTEAEGEPLPDVDPAEVGPNRPGSLSDIHPRMPLALPPERWDAWLDPALTDPERVRGLLDPPPPGTMRAHPVGVAVSNVRNNGPELVEALAAPEESTLF